VSEPTTSEPAPAGAKDEAFIERFIRVGAGVEGVSRVGQLEGEDAVAVVELARAGIMARIDLEPIEAELGQLTPAEQDAQIAAYVATLVAADAPIAWEEAQERVFVAIRPHRFFFTMSDDTNIVARRSVGALVECVALDRGRSITYVSDKIAEAWGVSPDDLFAVARANVESRLQHRLDPIDGEDPPKIFRLAVGDSFESSRLVSLEWLGKAREALGAGAMICAIPHRDALYIAIDASPPTLVKLAELAEKEFQASDRPITPALFVFTDEGDLGPLDLVDDHPIRERVRRGHLLHADAEYEAQKTVLDARLAKEGVELAIATHFAVEREGQVFSYCTWSEGGPALLPVVDVVAFAFEQEGRPPLLVTWDAAEAICGDLWEDVAGLLPPRKRVLGFPAGDRLAALAEHAIEL
jgi:uncharacterized protein YtpQ (UPF0354 family)